MANDLLNEAIVTVKKLNQEICDFFEDCKDEPQLPVFELRTDGSSIIIKFMGNYRLWFSEEDEREFYEEANEYESLEQYLRKEAQKIVDQVGNLMMWSYSGNYNSLG